ncbi:hypothetical protein [Nonomuraea bangladeshensis]|uniref:hypothetical protein n=1 Tax=Nonomuraea bangladeshensis TaxID=404385 RepID=UPI0031D9BB56
MDPTEFCDSLREEMTSALARLNDALPSLDWVEISDRKAGAIKLTPIEAAPSRVTCAGSRTRWPAAGAPSH